MTVSGSYCARLSTCEDFLGVRIEASADIFPRATVGDDFSIWHLAQVREDPVLGEGCTVGRGEYVGTGVRGGARCKIQNHALGGRLALLSEEDS